MEDNDKSLMKENLNFQRYRRIIKKLMIFSRILVKFIVTTVIKLG